MDETLKQVKAILIKVLIPFILLKSFEMAGVELPSTNSGAVILDPSTWMNLTPDDVLTLLTTAFLIDRFFVISRYVYKYGLNRLKYQYLTITLSTVTYTLFILGAHFGLNVVTQSVINPAFDISAIALGLLVTWCVKKEVRENGKFDSNSN